MRPKKEFSKEFIKTIKDDYASGLTRNAVSKKNNVTPWIVARILCLDEPKEEIQQHGIINTKQAFRDEKEEKIRKLNLLAKNVWNRFNTGDYISLTAKLENVFNKLEGEILHKTDNSMYISGKQNHIIHFSDFVSRNLVINVSDLNKNRANFN